MEKITREVHRIMQDRTASCLISKRIVLIDKDIIVYCCGDGSCNLTETSDFYRATKTKFNRETIIDAFSLVETLCAEIKILNQHGFMNLSNDEIDRQYRIYFKDKIDAIFCWGLIEKSVKIYALELAFVRNKVAHSLYFKNAKYWDFPLEDVLVQQTFRSDLIYVYEELIKVLHKLQIEKGYDQYLHSLMEEKKNHNQSLP